MLRGGPPEASKNTAAAAAEGGNSGLPQQHGFPLLALTAASAASTALLLQLLWRQQRLQHTQQLQNACQLNGMQHPNSSAPGGGDVTDAAASRQHQTPAEAVAALAQSLANGTAAGRAGAPSAETSGGTGLRQIHTAYNGPAPDPLDGMSSHAAAERQAREQQSRSHSSSPAGGSTAAQAALLAAVLAALLCLAHSIAAGAPLGRLRGGGAAAVAVNAATAAVAMHTMLSRLPRCFTVGASPQLLYLFVSNGTRARHRRSTRPAGMRCSFHLP